MNKKQKGEWIWIGPGVVYAVIYDFGPARTQNVLGIAIATFVGSRPALHSRQVLPLRQNPSNGLRVSQPIFVTQLEWPEVFEGDAVAA